MATADSVKAKIQDLIDSANATTGQNETDLTAAVNHLKEGFGQGGDNYYDTFWDSFQQNGQRTYYYSSFRTSGWNSENFKPKYPIVVVGDASYMFDNSDIGNQDEADFDFVEEGIELDLRGATLLTYAFRSCHGIKRLGVIDCTGCQNINRVFYSCRVVTIDKLVVHENLTYSSVFDYALRLQNITIDGTIAKNGLDFKSCQQLSKASIESIINALSTETSGLTVTISQEAVDKIHEAEDVTTWFPALAETRPNWNIVLAQGELI